MEKTMKIQKLLAIQDRQYNDQQGQPRVFTQTRYENKSYISTIKAI